MKKLVLTCLGLMCFTALLPAQTYSIDWYKIAGGGGTSTGGVYSLSGTIGQPDAGSMNGGNYSLVGGFWSVVAVAPLAGTPILTITQLSATSVRVSWPSGAAGFTLQRDSTLGNTNWIDIPPQNYSDDGTNKSIVVNPPQGVLFFRLKK